MDGCARAHGDAYPSPIRTYRQPTHALPPYMRCNARRRNLDLGLGGEWLIGDIAVLSVYNRELSIQEEQLLAQAYSCRFNLVPEGRCCACACGPCSCAQLVDQRKTLPVWRHQSTRGLGLG